MSEHAYVGEELDLFAQARHWKKYWMTCLRPYITGSVLEVGAGLGANTVLLRQGGETRWLCLEPDARLAARLEKHLARSALSSPLSRNQPLADAKQTDSPKPTVFHRGFAGNTLSGEGETSPAMETRGAALEVRVGTLDCLKQNEVFDTILYIDVLEHIQDDRSELASAAQHLAPGGKLIVLSPAHSSLFSPFDRAIGHFRRYTNRSLLALTPAELNVVKAFYLDSVGLLASAANRLLLRQSLPTAGQIRFWDRCLVPCSRALDPITGFGLGKSVVCIWERSAA